MLTFDNNRSLHENGLPRNAEEVKKLLLPVPEGYVKNAAGVQCRCIHSWTDGKDYYCRKCPGQQVSDNVVALPSTGRSDKEIAEDLRKRVQELMKPVLALMDEASAHGMIIRWAGLMPMTPFNKFGILELQIVKHL